MKIVGSLKKGDAEYLCEVIGSMRSSAKRYKAKDGFIRRKIMDNDILISIGENIANFNGYIQINESAAFLWNELKVDKSISELVGLLSDKYGIDLTIAEKDVLEFLEILEEHKMVILL